MNWAIQLEMGDRRTSLFSAIAELFRPLSADFLGVYLHRAKRLVFFVGNDGGQRGCGERRGQGVELRCLVAAARGWSGCYGPLLAHQHARVLTKCGGRV